MTIEHHLVFVPLPIEQPETVVAASRPLIDYLARQLNVPITIRYEKNYGDIIRLFKQGEIDVVYLGPLPYVTLRKDYPEAEPLVATKEPDGNAFYTCAMVTAFDGPPSINRVRHSVALTQPLSTCGHLSAGYLLDKYRIRLENLKHEYLGNHDAVALAVVRGDYEVGTMKTSVARKYINLTLRVLEETEPFPGFVLVANRRTMSSDQVRQIRKLLLEVSEKDRAGLVTGRYGFSAVRDADYNLIRQNWKFTH